MGTSKMFRIVGMEADRSMRPQKTAATRSEEDSQRVLAAGFSFSPGPAILRARLSLLKIKKKCDNRDKNCEYSKT